MLTGLRSREKGKCSVWLNDGVAVHGFPPDRRCVYIWYLWQMDTNSIHTHLVVIITHSVLWGCASKHYREATRVLVREVLIYCVLPSCGFMMPAGWTFINQQASNIYFGIQIPQTLKLQTKPAKSRVMLRKISLWLNCEVHHVMSKNNLFWGWDKIRIN